MPILLIARNFLSLLLALFFAGLLSSCSQPQELTPDQILLSSGANQMGPTGQESAQELQFKVLGPIRRSPLLGRKQRRPASEVRIKVEPLNPAGGAFALQPEGQTDAFGIYRTRLHFGNVPGDQYFRVHCPDHENVAPLIFHLVSGLLVQGAGQQAFAGDALPKPITVQVGTSDSPRVGVPVFFKLSAGAPQASLTATRVETNNRGIAATQLNTAEGYTGKYEILVEVGDSDAEGRYHFRSFTVTAMALSRMNLAIGVLGGLALFILGMTMMSDGLQLIAGNRLKNILQMFTGTRLTAVLAGLGITALIQSSSACSVMVVGFVNAGLLNLSQAIGVIFGSAIGTTVTAQMVSFKLDALALPAICLGVTTLLLARKSTTKGLAGTVLGFGLLFFGMTQMSKELAAIADFPSFTAAFQHFDCTPGPDGGMPILPVLGAILVGTVLTMVVQSSSATIGLTIAMAQSGLFNFYTAVPLILGDNIGTTVTGLLAALNANRTAKQAAVAATIFKSLGVVIMFGLFYVPWNGTPCFLKLVDVITAGDVFAETPENIGRHLASAHTLFNIINVIIFLPFVDFIGGLSRLIFPVRDDEDRNGSKICHLEPHLLNAPSAAIDQVLTALLAMTRSAIDLSKDAVYAFIENDNTQSEKIAKQESQIDAAQHDIMEYLVKLTRRNLSEAQSGIIPDLMHCVNDVERIGDRAINIFDLIENLQATKMDFSAGALQEIQEIEHFINETGGMLIDGLSRNDHSIIDKVIKRCSEIKQTTARFEFNHEARLHSRDCSVENGVIYVELLANLERVAAHLENLAERAHSMLDHRMSFLQDQKKKTT